MPCTVCYAVGMETCSTMRKAPAKANLHLAVSGKRADGYHDIESLFQRIGLYDTIHMSAKPSSKGLCTVVGLEDLCADGDDTMSKAVRLWRNATGFSGDLHISIEKGIPVRAGLGGGSSDAATVLLCLQEMFPKIAVDDQSLMSIGLQVGSDVPFFLSGYPTAWAQGRGELLQPIKPLQGCHALVVMPTGFDISTRQAFSDLDAIGTGGAWGTLDADAASRILCQDCGSWPFRNDFSQVVGHRELYGVLESMRGKGVFSSLTGSGAAWVLVSRDTALLGHVSENIHGALGASVQMFGAPMQIII